MSETPRVTWWECRDGNVTVTLRVFIMHVMCFSHIIKMTGVVCRHAAVTAVPTVAMLHDRSPNTWPGLNPDWALDSWWHLTNGDIIAIKHGMLEVLKSVALRIHWIRAALGGTRTFGAQTPKKTKL